MATLIARNSLMVLRGSPAQMAEELQRRRDTLGISYFSVNGTFIGQFAPVVELLAGRSAGSCFGATERVRGNVPRKR